MDIQITQIAIQLGIFLAVMVILRALVFKPLLRINTLRQKQTEGREIEAKDLMTRAQNIVAQYDQSMSEARAEARRKIQLAADEGSKQAKELVGKARNQGQQIFSEKKIAMIGERERAKGELNVKVEQLSNDFLKTILH
jgi:F-type H+-transporting ATPase subunit b